MTDFDDFPLPTRGSLMDALVQPRARPPAMLPRWAAVVAVAPSLRVHMIKDPTPVAVTPRTLVTDLAVGDLVWTVLTDKGDLIVVGKVGGTGTRTVLVLAHADTYVGGDVSVAGSMSDADGWPIAGPSVGLLSVSRADSHVFQRVQLGEAPFASFTRHGWWDGAGWIWSPWERLATSNPTRFRAVKTSTATLAAGYTRITNYDDVQYNVGSAFNNTTGFFVVPEDGLYFLTGHVGFASATTRKLVVIESGTATAGTNTQLVRHEGAATGYASLPLAVELELTAGESIALCAYSAAGSALAGVPEIFFSARKVI